MKFKSDFLKLMHSRGYYHQCSNQRALDDLMCSEKVVAYIGFDCTAESLHVGSLLQIMVLRYLQKLGHKPIVLLGGGTTKIGDPSGKDKSRRILSEQDIAKNITGIQAVLAKFLHFGTQASDAVIVNNADWLNKLQLIDFLREIGRHFSVNRMINFDSVKLRLEREQNLSFLEFNYMLLQAYDFTELKKHYGCQLQIGGADQWGNIVNGIDLGRKLGLGELFGLTTPLILTSSGEKMGKTAGGAVWLSEELYTPYQYWQYFRNVDDQDVGRFLRLFTELTMAEVENLEALKSEEINEAKKVLASEATKICFGEEASNLALRSAIQNFENNDDSYLPQFVLESFQQKITITELLKAVGFVPSLGEGKRLIAGGGCRIDNQVVTGADYVIDPSKMKEFKLSAGKKRHIKVVVSDV